MAKKKTTPRSFFFSAIIASLLIGIPLLIASISFNQKSNDTEKMLWVEDNNLHQAGGVPVDAIQMYEPEFLDQWEDARKHIKVYMYRYNSLKNRENDYTDEYLKNNLLPVLHEANIKLALDVPPPNWHCGNGEKLAKAEADYIQKISDLGGDVAYVSLQSVLSKPSDCPASLSLQRGEPNYTYEKRIDNVVRFTKYIKTRFPGMKVGIIDALVAKGLDYQSVYAQLVESLAKENLTLDYIHLDFPMEKADDDWQNLKEAEDFIRDELGIRVGVTYTSSKGGMTSAKTWQQNVLQAYKEYHAAGGKPDDLLIMSWYTYPRYNLPENKDYTLMNTVLKFSKH